MKSIIYLLLTVLLTSCSAASYLGNGRLKKVRVDRTEKEVQNFASSEVTQKAEHKEKNRPEKVMVVRSNSADKPAPIAFDPVQVLQSENASPKSVDTIVHEAHKPARLAPIPSASVIQQKARNFSQQEAGTQKYTKQRASALGDFFLMVLLTVGGILFLLLLIWLCVEFTQTVLLVLGIILVTAIILFVVGYPIVMIVQLINGDSVDGTGFYLWLSTLAAVLGGLSLTQ